MSSSPIFHAASRAACQLLQLISQSICMHSFFDVLGAVLVVVVVVVEVEGGMEKGKGGSQLASARFSSWLLWSSRASLCDLTPADFLGKVESGK